MEMFGEATPCIGIFFNALFHFAPPMIALSLFSASYFTFNIPVYHME